MNRRCEGPKLNPLGVKKSIAWCGDNSESSAWKAIPPSVLFLDEYQPVSPQSKERKDSRRVEKEKANDGQEMMNMKQKEGARESSIPQHVRMTAAHVPTSKTDGE
jgi:hypothetical protein